MKVNHLVLHTSNEAAEIAVEETTAGTDIVVCLMPMVEAPVVTVVESRSS